LIVLKGHSDMPLHGQSHVDEEVGGNPDAQEHAHCQGRDVHLPCVEALEHMARREQEDHKDQDELRDASCALTLSTELNVQHVVLVIVVGWSHIHGGLFICKPILRQLCIFADI
jgi:hypothetical protein